MLIIIKSIYDHLWLICCTVLLCALCQINLSFAHSVYSPSQRVIHFTNLDSERVLPHPVVNSIVQDRQGFIWIASDDGLTRYDGINAKQYEHIV